MAKVSFISIPQRVYLLNNLVFIFTDVPSLFFFISATLFFKSAQPLLCYQVILCNIFNSDRNVSLLALLLN